MPSPSDRGRARDAQAAPRPGLRFDATPAADPHEDAKAAWRREARRVRAGLDRAAWSRALLDTLRAWPRYLSAGTVASYLAFGSEPDLAELADAGRRLALPRMPADGGRLVLHVAGGPLARHALGMLEPLADAPRVDPAEVDLILIPGLAFDLAGGRLGYGAGHYDRLLPALRPEVPRVGVTHPALLAEALPQEAHDVRVTHLLLPGRVQAVAAAAASSQEG